MGYRDMNHNIWDINGIIDGYKTNYRMGNGDFPI